MADLGGDSRPGRFRDLIRRDLEPGGDRLEKSCVAVSSSSPRCRRPWPITSDSRASFPQFALAKPLIGIDDGTPGPQVLRSPFEQRDGAAASAG
jgi:hypothetical protein